MRRGGTTLVVLVVAAIALAAGFDALRGGSEPQPAAESEPPPAAARTTLEEPAEEEPPLADQLGGTLYYTDEDCELQAIELFGDRAVDPPNWDECRFVLSPNGRRVSGAGTGWDPYSDPLIGRIFQIDDGTIQVSSNGGPEGEAFAGEAPAWRPDGTLTYFGDGAVREWPSGDVVLSQRDLVRALRQSSVPGLAGFRRVRAREAAWLDDRRLATILSVEGPSGSWDVLASFDEGGIQETYVETPGRFADLRASPAGTYFAARRGQDGAIMAEPGRGEVNLPGIVGYRAIAWSPDDQWAAVAADGGVFIFRPGVPGPPELELAVDARDLDWRAELGPDAVSAEVNAGEAAAWLAANGLEGRLFVTQPGDGNCRLRALEIPGLGWAETPPGLENACRFTADGDGVALPEHDVPQPGGGEIGTCGDLDDCAFAWAPDGRPTHVTGGELFAGRPGGRTELLVSTADLERILGRPAALEEVAWVDDERFWAVVRSGETATVALTTAEGLVASPWFGAPFVEGLRVSSSGMAAVSSDRGVVFFDSGGRRALTFTNGRDVTWAPGEVVAAVSTPREVIFVAPLSGEVVTLPLEVRDLEWVAP
jgi:hypothetical protein